MSKKFVLTIISIIMIGVAAAVAILLAKGYTLSPQEKRIVGTGIITVASTPDSASVYVDGHLTTATNATISSLPPKTYAVKVVKEGFIPWEKNIEVKEGLVSEIKITLFPAIPTIYPLTYTGLSNAILSPDGAQLAYVVPATSAGGVKKAGIWVWTMVKNQPISFARSSEPHQITGSTLGDFSKAKLKWSPDSKQLLVTLANNNYLLEADRLNSEPKDITPTINSTLKGWQEDIDSKENVRLLTIKSLKIRQMASSSGFMRWSPDETKFMFRKEALTEKEASGSSVVSDIKVYDLETLKQYSLPSAKAYIWLPDSRHIVLVEENSISLVEPDGTNKGVIYAGSFKDNFVFPWPDSSRLVFISSLPTPTASEPNLYGINLK